MELLQELLKELKNNQMMIFSCNKCLINYFHLLVI